MTGGPNHNLSYFGDLSFPVLARYILNRAAMRRGSNFHAAQEPVSSAARTRLGGLNWCSQDVVPRLAALVEAHEREHIRVYADAFKREIRGAIRTLEPMTGSRGDLLESYREAWDGIDATAARESVDSHTRSDKTNLLTPRDAEGPCALKNEDGRELRN